MSVCTYASGVCGSYPVNSAQVPFAIQYGIAKNRKIIEWVYSLINFSFYQNLLSKWNFALVLNYFADILSQFLATNSIFILESKQNASAQFSFDIMQQLFFS